LGAIKHPVFCRPIGCVAGFVQCMAGPSPSTHKPSHREPSAAIQSRGVGLPRRCASHSYRTSKHAIIRIQFNSPGSHVYNHLNPTFYTFLHGYAGLNQLAIYTPKARV
jgi:hypothetical protein